jgi:hypothetical protein
MMKIRSLRLEHFRKFTEPVSISGLTDGVNVLAECNEFGKSTILAAIRGVLFERHGSKAQGVVSMQHWTNKTSPTICLDFELGNQNYRIEKRFLHREPYARFRMPDGSLFHGEEAEDQLQRVLHFTRAGKTGSKAEDIGMWGALWVTQRYSVEQPELPISARQTIHSCLDREVGALAGGTRGTTLLAAVRADFAKILNGNGKPVGRYKDAAAELEIAKERVTSLEGKQQALAADISDLLSAKRKLTEADGSGELTRTDQMLAEAHAKREAAQRHTDQESRAVANLELVEQRLLSAEQDVEQRSTLGAEISEGAKRLNLAEIAEGTASREHSAAETSLQEQRERARGASEACDAAGQAVRRARTLHDISVRFQTLVDLEGRLIKAEQAQSVVNQLSAQLISFTVTEEAVQAISSAEQQLQKTRAGLEAQATQVTLDLLPNAIPHVRLNGAEFAGSSLQVIEDLVIEIDGVGTLRIQPGIKDRQGQLSRYADEQRTLDRALRAVSVASLDDARQQLARRRHCEVELKDAQREVLRHTPAENTQQVGAGIEPLKNHIAVLRSTIEADLARVALDRAPELVVSTQALANAEGTELRLAEAANIAQAPLAQLEEDHIRTVRSWSLAQSALEVARSEILELKRKLQEAQAGESDESLSKRRSSAFTNVVVQRGVVAEMKQNRPIDSVVAMDARILRYRQAKKLISDQRGQILRDIAVLESRIARDEGVGIEEQLEEARRHRDDVGQECARFQREGQILELLRRTLEEAEREAKERYMAPVIQRITPYLQKLFPNASIRCDENFQITALMREGEQMERFEGLSDGTQEQIAVLTRLAFADMLLDSGRPAMVILDDALAYSDSDRLEKMFDVLAEASTRMQILVLTCRGELFTRLGGNSVRAEREAVGL